MSIIQPWENLQTLADLGLAGIFVIFPTVNQEFNR